MFLKRALELEPESRLIHQELAKVREQAREESESEKSLYRRMLGLKKTTTTTQEEKRYPVIKTVSIPLLFPAVYHKPLLQKYCLTCKMMF